MLRLAKPEEKDRIRLLEVQYLSTDEFWIVAHGELSNIPIEERPLPSHILLDDGQLMVLREKPVCIRKSSHSRDEHNKMYASLLMYLPWQNEVDYLGAAATSIETCQTMWEAHEEQCLSTAEELKRMLRNSALG